MNKEKQYIYCVYKTVAQSIFGGTAYYMKGVHSVHTNLKDANKMKKDLTNKRNKFTYFVRKHLLQ